MNPLPANHERETEVHSGWMMLPLLLFTIVANIGLLIYAISRLDNYGSKGWGAVIAFCVLMFPVLIVMLTGLFSLQPNEARVLILFGEYKGTVRKSGYHWGNPFYSNGMRATVQAGQGGDSGKHAGGNHGNAAPQIKCSRNKISLRARTLNMSHLKVNDKRGNPIEIAAVVVWRVHDTAQATFDVDNYESYVQTQSENALRHLASVYAYDHGEDNEITLRSGVDEVSQALRKELEERLVKAGVLVDEARLTHLAYAQEIAQAMLRRQQAEAVIAARQKIVHGAVSMVEMALKELAEKQVVHLDDERKAAMVSNLMIVLCSESEVHPVLNTGTLYT